LRRRYESQELSRPPARPIESTRRFTESKDAVLVTRQ